MRRTIYDLFNAAVMTKKPIILVEGVDDVKIYENISASINKKSDVYAIQWVDGMVGGGGSVEAAIDLLRAANANSQHKVEDYALGILDRDAREFRGSMPTDSAILVLKYYSIESHYVTAEVINTIVLEFTRVPNGLANSISVSRIMSNVELYMQNAYYFSLESLLTALVQGYESKFSYSYEVGRIFDEHTINLVLSKRKNLDIFAKYSGFDNSLRWLRLLTKGKWLLQLFCMGLINELKSLHALCRAGGVTKCQSCMGGDHNFCMYKMPVSITHKVIHAKLMGMVISDFDYIKERMGYLK